MARSGPFPGMDPWLESPWEGVHIALTAVFQELLNEALPADLVARLDERVYVGYGDETPRSIRPDLFVAERGGAAALSFSSQLAATVDRPVVIHFSEEVFTQAYLEIVSARDASAVVTAVELSSKTNKSHVEGRRDYLRKREEYHRAGVSVVEIDLLRGGPHVVDVPLKDIPDRLQTPYKVCVRRGWKVEERVVEYYGIPLRSRLPRVAVPLRPTDEDVTLDVQKAFDTIYRRGRFESTDYSRSPDPPLAGEDEAWAQERLKAWRESSAI